MFYCYVHNWTSPTYSCPNCKPLVIYTSSDTVTIPKTPCCRLTQEMVCAIVRNRSGIDSGELDYTFKEDRVDADLDNVILEVERLLTRLKERKK